MSLLTIQRSPTPPDLVDSSNSQNESSSNKSQSEDFYTSNGAAILQNQFGRRRSSIIVEGDTLQYCLKKTVQILRKEDSLKIIVDLEKVNSERQGHRCFCIISTVGKTDKEEFAILGIDVCIGSSSIGFVLPIYQDISVCLDGDGGFRVNTRDEERLFKPTSVHSLWTIVQLLNKACAIAQTHNFYSGGLNHTWIGYYVSSIRSNRAQIAEWNKKVYADHKVNSNLAPKSAVGEFVLGSEDDEIRQTKDLIRTNLKEIMQDEDMDNVTVIYLRTKLQEQMTFNVQQYRSFIAEEILIIYGQMDEASEILPHLFLGSTYNSSDLEELQNKNISHILNVTRESENFFRENFKYKNIEVMDVDETNLMNYFDSAHKFINEVKPIKKACLVHCQRGISRSATIVISYLMKECTMGFEEAYQFVKSKRECVRPNDGFLVQLKTYEGMLSASSNRYNSKFRGKTRSEIRSVPNETDIPLDFPSINNSSMSIPKRQSSIDQTRTGFSSTPPGIHSDAIYSENSMIELQSSDSVKFDLQNDLLIFKNNSSSVSDCMGIDAGMDPSGILKSDTASESEKKSFRLKNDKSWIKQFNASVEKSDIDSSATEAEVMVRVNSCHERIVKSDMFDSSMLPRLQCEIDDAAGKRNSVSDIDKEPIRPVKELCNKYTNSDGGTL